MVSTTQLDFPEGETRTYTVVLDTQPSASVTITVTASDDPSKCRVTDGPSCTRKPVATVDENSLTFTTSDWNMAQTVTVTAVDEDMAGVWKYARITHQAIGGGYDGVSIPEVGVSVADDDIHGVRYYNAKRDGSPGSTGGNVAFWEHQSRILPETTRFYASLYSEPTATTTVMHQSPDPDVATLTGGATLTFTTSDWNTPQPVDVEVVDNQIDEGGQIRTHRLRLDVTVAGTGSDYDGHVPNAFFVDVWNNDVAGLVFSPTSLVVAEGDDASYTVKLATEPTNTVTVAIMGHAGTDLTLDKQSLTFTPSTWNDPLSVTVKAGEDADTSNDTVTLTHAAAGGGYDDVEADLTVTVSDGWIVTLGPASPSTIAEGGDGAEMSLTSEGLFESGRVTVGLTLGGSTTSRIDYKLQQFFNGRWVDLVIGWGRDRHFTSMTLNTRNERLRLVALSDARAERDETATLTLHEWHKGPYEIPTDVTLAGSASVTIEDATPAVPVVSISGGDAVTEGGGATFTLTADPAPAADLPVSVTIGQSGDFVAADDLGNKTVTINGGQTSATYPVATVDDETDEADGAVTATVTAGDGYTVADSPDDAASVTVNDNDGATTPAVSFASASASVGEGSGTRNVTVNLSPAPASPLTLSYTLSGTATRGSDYSISGVTTNSGTLSVSSGATTATIAVAVTDDSADEGNETVVLTLTEGSGYAVGSPSAHTLTITDDDGTEPPTQPMVSLSVAPNPVDEGSSVTVTARLSEALSGSVTIPLVLTAGAAESGDYGALGSITVGGGQTTGTGAITTAQDADEDDETFTVALGNLPPEVTPGSPSSIEVTIRDDDGTEPPTPPMVSLSVAPNPVDEGSSVTVTARLSEALSGSVTIPLVLTAGTAESGDYGALGSITVGGGQTTGTGAITTAQDADEDDETFTVALGNLPPEVTPGSPSSIEVTIRDHDDDGGGDPPEPPEPPVNGPPTARASCDPRDVVRGGEVRLTAMASDPDGDTLSYRWSAPAGSFAGPTDRSAARWTAPAETGRVRIRVEVSDGRGGSASVTCAVEVVNRPPAFEASVYRFELAENLDGSRQSIHLGRVAAEDPDGDELAYDVSGGDREHFRIGSRDGVVKYVGPGEDYEAEPNRYELTVQAQDPFGAAAEARVVVTVTNVNERPEAEDDAAETPEDEAVTVDVLANDTDPDGDSLRVESVSAPEHGTTRIAAGGGVLYTPEANYHGADRFTYVVTDPEGETASAAVEVTVLSVNDAPAAVGAIPDQPLDEGGGSVNVELTPYFEDVDGDELAYRAASSDTDVATVRVAGAVLTVTPVVYGSARVTVTAEDPEGLTATQTFTVGVDDRLVRAVLGNTLAAMARSHLASARMTLGRRVEAGGTKESRLTVMGRAVPLGKAAAWQAAEQMVMGLLSSGACSGSSAHGLGGTSFGTAGAAPGLGGYPAGGCGGPATGGPALGASAFGGPGLGGPMSVGMPPGSTGGLYGFGGFGGGPDALLQGTEFELTLGDEEDGGGGWLRRRLSVWGQGDIQTFHGTPTVYRYDARYDGDMRTGYVGVDARLTERWLAGVAVSRSGGRSDWQVGASRGHLKTKLTALHPYAQWSDGTTSLWTMAGGGWGDGEAENVREATGLLGTSTLGLRLGLVELRRELGATGGGAEFGLRADAAWAELRTGEGRETVDGLAAAVNQQRVGAEVARPLRLGLLALQPFGAAHLRRDGGAGQTGTGVEVAFGLGLTGGIVRLDVQARTLAVHSAAGYGERGAGLTLTVGGQKREGLSLSVSPTWGDAASGTGALWQEEVYRHYLPEKEQDTFAVDARGDYGMRLPNGGLLSWFGSYSHSPYGRGFLVGGSIGGLADALLPGR